MRVVPVDDVLIRVVDVVLPNKPGRRLMAQQRRELLSVELLQQPEQTRHEPCFSLQVMDTRAHGMPFTRAGAIGSPQSRQMPYVPFSSRKRAFSLACRILASVFLCFGCMW